ncbi:MAG: hypothetical protein U0Q21_09600 [Dermatophilaceae bacterium]
MAASAAAGVPANAEISFGMPYAVTGLLRAAGGIGIRTVVRAPRRTRH